MARVRRFRLTAEQLASIREAAKSSERAIAAHARGDGPMFHEKTMPTDPAKVVDEEGQGRGDRAKQDGSEDNAPSTPEAAGRGRSVTPG